LTTEQISKAQKRAREWKPSQSSTPRQEQEQVLLAAGGPKSPLAKPVAFAGACDVHEGADVQDAFTFVDALIDSFGVARVGVSRFTAEEAQGSADDPESEFSKMLDLMVQFKLALEDYKCAARVVSPFVQSTEKAIHLSSQSALLVYTEQIRLLSEGESAYKQWATRPDFGNMDKLVTTLEHINATMPKSWQPLAMVCAPKAGFALVMEPANPNDRMSRLRVTTDQLNRLKAKLENIYGPSVKGGAVAGMSYLDGAGTLLYTFLADSGFKSLDAK
jgi:hypothetical protein